MAAKRTRINPGRGGARFVRRNKQGQFKEVESVGRSLTQDRGRKAKNEAKRGEGDRGDRGRTSMRGTGRGRSSAGMKSGGGRKGTRTGGRGGRAGTARHAARR